jgi:CheY-like chemotaxis protein
LPIALEFAKKIDVIGFDINAERVRLMQNGIDPSRELDAEVFKDRSITFTAGAADLKAAQFFVVAVPTPIDAMNLPDLEAPAPIKPRERRPCEDGPVLLVDDEDDLRESLSWLLEPTPTASARSIGEARARILQGGVSAVLCDLQMPTGLGTDLLDWLREADPRLATRFAFMTGGALTPSARAALEGSGVPILEKPFGRDAVVALLDSLAPTC